MPEEETQTQEQLTKFASILSGIWWSFPIQLVLLHLKKHLILLAAWAAFIMIVTANLGADFGLHYLFWQPEYLGEINLFSFFLLGAGMGLFFISWHVSSYILNAFRFPFLASLSRPFAVYCINNSILPILFVIIYCVSSFQFLSTQEAWETQSILKCFGMVFAGATVLILFSLLYFFSTHRNLSKYVKKLISLQKIDKSTHEWMDDSTRRFPDHTEWKVLNYFSIKFRVNVTRSVKHYNYNVVSRVIRQHRGNALVFILLIFFLLFLLGLGLDNPYFNIPASASLFILGSIYLLVSGAFSYMFRGWKVNVFVLAIILLPIIRDQFKIYHKNEAYGLDYASPKKTYNFEVLNSELTLDSMQSDYDSVLTILENWKTQNQVFKRRRRRRKKPKLVFINASGGGARGALWTFSVLEKLDSLTSGKFFQNTFAITGASGGIIGASYYRELAYHRSIGDTINWEKAQENIAKDLLNPIVFSLVVNDLFFPLQRYQQGNQFYTKDRSYAFESKLNQNTDHVLNKPLSHYKVLEQEAKTPMLIMTPSVLSEDRKLFISPHKLRFLCRPYRPNMENLSFPIDGIDFNSFFQNYWADSIQLSTAIRINATYPVILPSVHLPTDPGIVVMDAGLIDNFGFETTERFLYTYQDWINENVSEVVIISINSVNREVISGTSSGIQEVNDVFGPLSSLLFDITEIQRKRQRARSYIVNELLEGKLKVLEFNYVPEKKNMTASMSFHLSKREKLDVIKALNSEVNQSVFEAFKTLYP